MGRKKAGKPVSLNQFSCGPQLLNFDICQNLKAEYLAIQVAT